MTEDNTARIAALNDAFRTTFRGGKVLLTRGIAALPAEDIEAITGKVRGFTDFSADNDPRGEHDFGSFRQDGAKIEFRVEGPPGASSVADAGLATLEPYVRETQPARGSRAVYRHYDLNAAFRADYVDHMYRSASRTLLIELRADDGTIASVANTMGKGTEIVLRREERTWLHTLSRTSCQLTLDESKIVRESAVRAQLGASPLPHVAATTPCSSASRREGARELARLRSICGPSQPPRTSTSSTTSA